MSHSERSPSDITSDSVIITHRPELTPDCYIVTNDGESHVVLLLSQWCSCPVDAVCSHRRWVARNITNGKLTAPSDIEGRSESPDSALQDSDPEIRTDGGTTTESGEPEAIDIPWRSPPASGFPSVPSETDLSDRVGQEWELLLVDQIREYIFENHAETIRDSYSRLSFGENPELQKSGIDMMGGGADLKTRTFGWWDENNPDVFVELEKNKADSEGWARNKQSIFVPYAWETEDRTNIEEAVLIIKRDGFDAWVDRVSDTHEIKPSDDSKGVIVPIQDIPEMFIDKQIDLTRNADLPVSIIKMAKYRKIVEEAYPQL